MTLYSVAKALAKNTPDFGESFAGKCGNISLGLLEDARKIFGAEVQLVIGWVEIKNTKHFHVTNQQVNDWIKQGIKQTEYNLHCWLSLNEDPIDLTLAETLYDYKDKKGGADLLPGELTYIGPEEAKKYNIIFHKIRSGDNILQEIGML